VVDVQVYAAFSKKIESQVLCLVPTLGFGIETDCFGEPQRKEEPNFSAIYDLDFVTRSSSFQLNLLYES
jgi:hypothetical protein